MKIQMSNHMLREANCNILCELAENNLDIVILEADLLNSSGLLGFKEKFPDRLHNCGIQEANMMGVAGGLSIAGYFPVIHTFAAFASRRMTDQIFMAGVYNKQNVIILGSDPGICNSGNGGTHMSFEDIGIMRSMPNITILDPADEIQLASILPAIFKSKGMYYIRLHRKTKQKIYSSSTRFQIGTAHKVIEGSDVTLIATGGLMLGEAIKASEMLKQKGIFARVVDMFTIKPIDIQAIIDCAAETKAIITVENHNIYGGLGSAVAEVLAENACQVPFARIGFPDTIGETGTIEYLQTKYGLDSSAIVKKAISLLGRKNII